MAPFVKGDRVKIRGTEYGGTVADVFCGGQLVDVSYDKGTFTCFPAEWLELCEPHSWPPQLGDIWEADGQEYYVRRHYGNKDEIVIGSVETPIYFRSYTNGLAMFMDLKPVLVRRRGVN